MPCGNYRCVVPVGPVVLKLPRCRLTAAIFSALCQRMTDLDAPPPNLPLFAPFTETRWFDVNLCLGDGLHYPLQYPPRSWD